MKIRSLVFSAATLAALALPVALASAASASTAPPLEGTAHFTDHGDTDFSGQFWAADSFSQHMTITSVVQDGPGYDYTVDYADHGVFVTLTGNYVGQHATVQIPDGARGVFSGTGEVTVKGAAFLPDQAGLKSMVGFPQFGDTGVGTILSGGGTITGWTYDYRYAIPGTSFTAEQSDTVNTP